MIYEEFVAYLIPELRKQLPTSVDLAHRQLPQNNGVILDILSLRQDETELLPSIILDEYWQRYQSGLSLTLILEEIAQRFQNALHQPSVTDIDFADLQTAKKYLAVKLIHREKNAELLKDLPHLELLDLAVVYYLYLFPDYGLKATMPIHWEHLQIWDISPKELYHLAMDSSQAILPPVLQSIDDFIDNRLQAQAESQGAPLEKVIPDRDSAIKTYILSNSQGYNGAGCLVYPYMLKKCAERLQGSYYLLPTSVHEFMLTPALPNLNTNHLREMLLNTNQNVTPAEDWLSDNIYHYEPGKGLSIVE